MQQGKEEMARPLLIATGEAIPLRILEGFPGWAKAPMVGGGAGFVV